MQNVRLTVDQSFSLQDMPERDLIAAAAQGNEDAFEIIMRRHNRLLFRTARSILGNDSDAEEALQEAYLNAWKAMEGFRADARFSTWLTRIVINEALGRMRRKGVNVIPLDTAMKSLDMEVSLAFTEKHERQPEQLAMRAQLRQVLETHIDLLPDMYRTVFMLRAIEEMSTLEVAEVLQIPEPTVRTRFSRARTLLRTSLASDIDVSLEEVFSFDGERCDRIVAAVLKRGREIWS